MNVRALSMVSVVTTRVSPEEMCLPSFEVLNCWLNLVASCLDDENELPQEVIDSFSALRFSIFSVCARICGSGCLYSILAVHVKWNLFYGGNLACSVVVYPLPCPLLFATTRSVVKSVKVAVVEVTERTNGSRHRSSGDKSVGVR